MNNQQILDEAPEGATHVDDEFNYWILSENQNIKSQSWIDTRKGWRSLSIEGFSFRSLADIEQIVILQSIIQDRDEFIDSYNCRVIEELEIQLHKTTILLNQKIDYIAELQKDLSKSQTQSNKELEIFKLDAKRKKLFLKHKASRLLAEIDKSRE